MTSVTMAINEDFKKELKSMSFVNWSEIAREEARKKLIFEKFMKTNAVSYTDWEFCERIDWHPVDELPLKAKFVKELDKIYGEHKRKYGNKTMTLKDVDALFK